MKKLKVCFFYLLMLLTVGISILAQLAGISCSRLEEYRQLNRFQEQTAGDYARKQAQEILRIYMSRGMSEADAYANAVNVNYIIQKVGGSQIGGNYSSKDAQQILQQYSYHFTEDTWEGVQETGQNPANYIVKIAYLQEEQIQAALVRLEGIPDNLEKWINLFFATSVFSALIAIASLWALLQMNGQHWEKQNLYDGRLVKMPPEILVLWWLAVIPVWMWGQGIPRVWNIPITWEKGAEPMLSQLGRSIQGMTLYGLALGFLGTGFLLHLSIYRKVKDKWIQRSPLWRVAAGVSGALEKLSWFKKALILLLSICVLEAVGIGMVQHKIMQGAGYGQWLVWEIWGLGKIVLCSAVLRTVKGMMRLKTSAGELAKGNLGYQIPLEGLSGEVLRLARDMNAISYAVADAVEDRMKSERLKTELITNVSHDIKTPLTSIINYADLIGREHTDNERIVQYAQILYRQSARLKKLIEDLMEASKAATGDLEVFLERCQAGVLLSQAVGEFEHKLQERGLELIVRQEQEPVWILADPRMLWRILDNLMTNICKYAQSNTRVYLSMEAQDGQAVLTFKNISRYALDVNASELAERFVRGDKSRHTEGNGLGLAIAKSLTELQGGDMQLVADGDLFKVVLSFPIAKETDPTEPGISGD